MNKQLVTLIIVVVVATILYIITGQLKTQNISLPCTHEARICPDGTALKRTGPNCLFPACPTKLAVPTPTVDSAEKMFCGGIKGIICPTGYECNYTNKSPDASGNCEKKAGFSFSSIYTCPKTQYVDCMPGPNPPKKECSSDFLNWAISNCQGFKGAAY